MNNPFPKRTSARHAFSLVELLVVLAITTIILGLLFGPIISSFNLTRKARALSQAQDAARFGLERLSRDLAQATYIYDNGLAPVAIPMNYPAVPTPSGNIAIGGANANQWPTVAYGRIDVVQPAVRQSAGDIIDPTTGKPVGGAELQPGVRGKRVTRYFLGLRNPRNADGSTRLYENIYEFRRADDNLNPVIMYRAEYDPRDPNLFNVSSAAAYESTAANAGGFNDPAFFYGTGAAANGRTYGENWQRISQAVITSENLDLLRWNRAGLPTERDQKDATTPFSATTTFTPVAVPDDVAAPGFLTSGGVETPAAVPTLYQTKYGAWTYPYTITVLRGSTNYGGSRPDSEPFGKLILTVDRDNNGNIFVSQLNAPATIAGNPNTLATTTGNIYPVFSATTRTLFVKTPALTFSINPDRGRIETAFPPLYGTSGTVSADGGRPWYYPAGSGTATLATPGVLVTGETIPLRFVQDTRDPNAGRAQPSNPLNVVPSNQGITRLDLLDPFVNRYQLAAGDVTGATVSPSPVEIFGVGGGDVWRGIRVIPGSERVSAPVVDGGVQTSWVRVAAALTDVVQPVSTLFSSVPPPPIPYYSNVPERLAQYGLEFDTYPADQNARFEQLLTFDDLLGYDANTGFAPLYRDVSGMAAGFDTGANYVTVSYLWQNNFSRDPRPAAQTWGRPLDSTGAPIADFTATRPEADIFRVNYATRQQYSINLGARIYDPTDGRASSIRVSDKVIINNALR